MLTTTLLQHPPLPLPLPPPPPLQSSLTPTLLAHPPPLQHLLPQIQNHAQKNTPKLLKMTQPLLKHHWKMTRTQKGARRGRGTIAIIKTTLLIGV